MFTAVFGLLISSHRDPRVRFLLCQLMLVYGLVCFLSLNATGKGKWPVPALVGSIVLLLIFWGDVVWWRPSWRWSSHAALILGGMMTLGLHFANFVNRPLVNKLMNHSQGWPDYAAHIERARTKYQSW